MFPPLHDISITEYNLQVVEWGVLLSAGENGMMGRIIEFGLRVGGWVVL